MGRSFASFTRTEMVTDEPIDYPFPEEEKEPDLRLVPENNGSYLGTIREGNVSNYQNEIAQGEPREVHYVTPETARFLRGPLATKFIPYTYLLVFLFSVPLNAVALVLFACRIQEKKPAVVFMLNLACADLLFTLLLPLNIYYRLSGSDWVFGSVMCGLVTAAYYCYMYCSVLLMTCISVDRMLAVVYPIASLPWRSSRNAAAVCAGAWALALAGTVPLFLVEQTVRLPDLHITTCHDVLPDAYGLSYLAQFSILSCVYFFLPLVVTAYCYVRFVCVLWAAPPVHSVAVSRLSKQKKHAIAMAITVATEFVVCFTPTNAILLAHCLRLYSGGGDGEGDAYYAAYLLSLCLGSVSTCLDPLLYYYGSTQCKNQLTRLMVCRTAKKGATSSDSSRTSTRSCRTNTTHIQLSSQYNKLLA